MSRRNRENFGGRPEPPAEKPGLLSPGTMRFATLCGVAILLFMVATDWSESLRFQRELKERLNDIESRLSQVASKVDAAGRAAQVQRPQGPDPNRVYQVRTDGAPVEGPRAAPVSVVEFSDFQ